MDGKQPIAIDDNMSEDLKFAINYLNERNISLDDKIEVHYDDDDDEDENDSDDFNGMISDVEDSDILDDEGEEDEIIEQEVDTSDLDSLF